MPDITPSDLSRQARPKRSGLTPETIVKQVLVTGGTGFIGPRLVSQLVRQGHRVRCLMRRRGRLPDGVEAVRGDLHNTSALRSALEGVDVVYHLAGATIVRHPLVYRNAQGVEARRLSRTGRASWHNAIYQNYAISLLFLMGCLALWGWASAGVFLFQAVFTIFSVQAITFIQHYGLVRKAGEAIAAHHSWADNCVIANALTFNNNHHSQHHLEPRTPYFHLRTHPEAPRLPASYMVMFVVAMVPVWWRAVMDKRLVKHQEFIGRHAEQLARRQSHRLIG